MKKEVWIKKIAKNAATFFDGYYICNHKSTVW